MPTAQQAILLAEDDHDIAEMISECLQGEDYAVTAVDGVAAAIEVLATRKFALVLTDAFANQGLGSDQWTAIEQIRRAAGTTPTIICTAHRSQDFSAFAAHGFAALLSKPFDVDDLIALVNRLTRLTVDPYNRTNTAQRSRSLCAEQPTNR